MHSGYPTRPFSSRSTARVKVSRSGSEGIASSSRCSSTWRRRADCDSVAGVLRSLVSFSGSPRCSGSRPFLSRCSRTSSSRRHPRRTRSRSPSSGAPTWRRPRRACVLEQRRQGSLRPVRALASARQRRPVTRGTEACRCVLRSRVVGGLAELLQSLTRRPNRKRRHRGQACSVSAHQLEQGGEAVHGTGHGEP